MAILNVVTGYGADPTGGADASTAFQNAINAAVALDTIYIPTGVYKLNTTLTFTTNRLKFLGDGMSLSTLFTTRVGAGAMFSSSSTIFTEFRDLAFVSFNAFNQAIASTAGTMSVNRCRWIGFIAPTSGVVTGLTVILCSCFGTIAQGVTANHATANLQCTNCDFYGGVITVSNGTMDNCLFIQCRASNSTISANNVYRLNRCTIVGPWTVITGTGPAWLIGNVAAAGTIVFVATNCLFCDAITYGLGTSVTLPMETLAINCGFYNNASGACTSDIIQINSKLCTVNPFVDQPGFDYRLNNATNGGALLTRAGSPIPGANGDAPDIGAIYGRPASGIISPFYQPILGGS